MARFCRDGDLAVLGELYGRYMDLVYGVCLRYLGEREQAKDEVMNLFEKLVTALPQQEIARFRPWLYVVTKNHCLMLLRSRKSGMAQAGEMMNDPLFRADHLVGSGQAGDFSGSDYMENRLLMHPYENDGEEELMRLEECIGRLKEEQKSCIGLFYYEGCSYRQISSRLGMEENRVKSCIQNGKRNLKICIESLRKTGLPLTPAGGPERSAGLPEGKEGRSDRVTGEEKDKAGMPERGAGIPGGDTGTAEENDGMPGRVR